MEKSGEQGNDGDYKELKKRISALEQFILNNPSGGVLSSADFLDLCVPEEEATRYLEAFGKSDWNNWENDLLFKTISRAQDLKQRMPKFLIKPFDKFNVTPFSYDLSIGNQVYCLKNEARRSQYLNKDDEYLIEPHETVVVITKEYIVLPPFYAATIWPRFDPVREGIFQSMVKIDPTWRGKLAVALTNVSPAKYPIKMGQAFGTLILYNLSRKTGFSLSRPEDIESTEVKLDKNFFKGCDKATREHKLRVAGLSDLCDIVEDRNNTDGKLLVRSGIRKGDKFRDLFELFQEKEWHDAVMKAKEDMINKGRIGASAYKMENLDLILLGEPKGRRPTRSGLKEIKSLEDLETAALQHGGPFELLPSLPEFIAEKSKEKVKAEVEASLFPKLVTLTLSILGMLSLVTAVVALLLSKYSITSPLRGVDWPGTIAWVAVALCVLVLVAFFLLYAKRLWWNVEIGPTRRLAKDIDTKVGVLETKVQILEKQVKEQNPNRA